MFLAVAGLGAIALAQIAQARTAEPPLRAGVSPVPGALEVDEVWRAVITLRRGVRLVDARRVSVTVAGRVFPAVRVARGRYRADIAVATSGSWRYRVLVVGRRVSSGLVVVRQLALAGGFDVVREASGDLLVGDSSNRVFRVGADGALSIAARLTLPTELAVDPRGGYAVIGNLHDVVHVSPAGTTRVAQLGELGGLAFGPDAALYAAEVAGRVVYVDVATGAVTELLRGLARPHGLEARGSELLVAEAEAGRILSLDLDSGVSTVRVTGLTLPIDIASAPDDTLYVADYGAGQIVRSGAGGTSVLAAVPRVNGVAVGADGAIYATQRDLGRLLRVDPATGSVSALVGGS